MTALSAALQRYLQLENQHQSVHDGPRADELLDALDAAWYGLSATDRIWLDNRPNFPALSRDSPPDADNGEPIR